MMQENLKLAPQVMLKGGTELDVAELYYKMEGEVYNSKNTILRQQNTLNELNNKLEIQNKKIGERENQLLNIQTKYNSISDSLLLLSHEFESKKDALNSKETEMASLLKSINEFTVHLNQQKEKIQSINMVIKEKENKILEQDKTMEEQSGQINLHQKKEVQQKKTIKNQYYINLIVIIILILVIIISVQYFRSLKKEKKTNKLISEQNHQLIQTASELKLAKEAAEAANKELEAFAYSVSHDLRAPLRYISGFVDMLSKDIHDQLPEKSRHYLNVINDSALKMGKLIDDLLSFSRTGRAEMKKTTFSMNQVVEEAKSQVKLSITHQNINWEIANLPDVFGDYNLLRLVWVNLLDNAVKYTRTCEKAVIHIDCSKEKEEFVFSIRDNGVGFDMKYAHKLFGVFQRLHSVSEFEGTGIGLANVRRIILRHGGQYMGRSRIK